jgi:hypothetical protein
MLQLLRRNTPLSLDAAHNLFGITFGMGIRNRAPRKGEEPVMMHYGDAVNMVDVVGNSILEHFNKFSSD